MVKIGKWSGKTKITIISSKKQTQFTPQFWSQIVAGVETHRYSAVLGPDDHFGQSYEENQVQKNRHRIYHTILKTPKSIFVPGFSILLESTIDLDSDLVIALFAWAPQPISGFYIVLLKSATRLINNGNLHIKTSMQSGSTRVFFKIYIYKYIYRSF